MFTSSLGSLQVSVSGLRGGGHGGDASIVGACIGRVMLSAHAFCLPSVMFLVSDANECVILTCWFCYMLDGALF